MKTLILCYIILNCLLLIALAEADLNQPLVPATAILLVLGLALYALELRRHP